MSLRSSLCLALFPLLLSCASQVGSPSPPPPDAGTEVTLDTLPETGTEVPSDLADGWLTDLSDAGTEVTLDTLPETGTEVPSDLADGWLTDLSDAGTEVMEDAFWEVGTEVIEPGPCDEEPCLNGGACVEQSAYPTATPCLGPADGAGCPDFPLCQAAVCALDPYCCDAVWDASCGNCAKGGTGYGGLDCTPVGNACVGALPYFCECDDGFAGAQCQVAVPDCLDAGCLYGEDYAALTQGVTTILSGGMLPSSLILHGDGALPVVADEAGRVFIAAARAGKGRAFVFAHEGYLKGALTGDGDVGQLALNALAWVAPTEQPTVGVLTGFSALHSFLEEHGYSVQWVTKDDFTGVDILCIPSFSDYTEEQTAAIKQFVADGGGALVAGHAWWWANTNENVAVNYPGNKLLSWAGITWTPYGHVTAGQDMVSPEPLSPMHHAGYALDLFLVEQTGVLEVPAEQMDVGVVNVGMAIDVLPFEPFAGYFAKVEAFAASVGEVVPSPIAPVQKKVDHAKAIVVHHDVKKALELPAEALVPHPAAALFPGSVPVDAVTSGLTVTINASYEGMTASFLYAGAGAPVWRSTGIYAPPAALLEVTVPESAAGVGLVVLVGCHTDDLWGKDSWSRVPRIVRTYPIQETVTKVANAFGGLVYLQVPAGTDLGDVPVTISGGALSPRFVHGETDLGEWVETIRYHPAPWAELESDRFVLSIASEEVRELDDPDAVLDYWNAVLDADADLAAIPHDRPRPERIVSDVQISAGALHSGYPIMGHLDVGPAVVDLATLTSQGNWGIFHELGHNHQWKHWMLPGTTEATVNLWSIYAMEKVVGLPSSQTHPAISPENRQQRILDYLASGPDFGQWSVWTALETYLQLQEGFGWAAYQSVFAEYYGLTPSEQPANEQEVIDQWLVRFSMAVERNLGPFFQAWAIPVSPAALDAVADLPAWGENPMLPYLE